MKLLYLLSQVLTLVILLPAKILYSFSDHVIGAWKAADRIFNKKMNPKRRNLEELADMCAEKNHLWWLGALQVTWLICSTSAVEREIARAAVAHLSWEESGDGGNFLACFDIRSALKYTRHAKDKDFKKDVRDVLQLMREDITNIAPWLKLKDMEKL